MTDTAQIQLDRERKRCEFYPYAHAAVAVGGLDSTDEHLDSHLPTVEQPVVLLDSEATRLFHPDDSKHLQHVVTIPAEFDIMHLLLS